MSFAVFLFAFDQNATETDVLRREKDLLQNELRIQQDLVAKLQVQQQQNGSAARANRLDEVNFHQKEALERKLRTLFDH